MTFISLFAGIGGFDLGFERAGMTCVAQVEVDLYCQKILTKHWPTVPKFGDIHDVGKHNLPTADLICGGFPCQPHSLAGKRRGSADDRDLWPEMCRVIEEIRPNWIVAENVLGIRTTILDQVLSDLENLAYATGTLVIPACAFNAPHRRDRIFVIAYTEGKQNRWIFVTQFSANFGTGNKKRIMANASGTGLSDWPAVPLYEQMAEKSERHNWWQIEPRVDRVVDGVPHRVDRLRALGNAVVPQVAEFIGRIILEIEQKNERER